MKNTTIAIFSSITILFIFGGCISSKPDGYKELSAKNQRQTLKDYALCSCLKLVADGDSIKSDISFSILMELSDYNSVATKSIDSLSKLVVAEIKPSQIADHNGKKPYTLSCINYYNGKRLDSLIRLLPLREISN